LQGQHYCEERKQAFASIFHQLETATDYQALVIYIQSISDTVQQFLIPQPCTSHFPVEMIDQHALSLNPTDGPPDMVPIKSIGDGNCFYNSVSILLVGTDEMATELRVRTVLAMIGLNDLFQSQTGSLTESLLEEQAVLYAPYGIVQHADLSTTPSREEIANVFIDEVLHTATKNSYAGMWHIHALASAVDMAIWSVYPQYNINIRHVFHKLIQPIVSVSNTVQILPIM
jgi:hypothetical protein